MVFSQYLFRIPYSLTWRLLKLQKKLEPVVFYCGDPLDYYVFAPVEKYLKKVTYATDKKSVKAFLKNRGIAFKALPVFSEAVIMARHSTHKFPCSQIIKIGMRHGAYHFKKMTSASSYNEFDLYLMTSEKDVQAGARQGIRSARAVGFPKLDPAFNKALEDEVIDAVKIRLNIINEKPTILCTATYDASGMSAIDLWYDKLSELTEKYNILVTTHPWLNKKFATVIEKTPDIHYIKDYDILPYIRLADIVIGDTSSILAECCALDKPIITFEPNKARRSLDEIDAIIKSISYRISGFTDLSAKIEHALSNPAELAEARAKASRVFFDNLDGRAGERAAKEIQNLLKARGKHELV